MTHYTSCPCCSSEKISKALSAKDYTVTMQEFEIWHCNTCTCRFTQDAPGKAEISGYYKSEDYISHSDTKKGLVNSLYHYVRGRTLKNKRKLVEKYTKVSQGKILDIGAGTAAFLHTMHKAGWQVKGLEPDTTAREKAASRYGLALTSPEQLFNLHPASLDAITLWHVLEHVHDLHEYMDQFKKILKPGGCLFIAVPNYTSYDAAIYKEYWAAWDVPRHLYHFSPGSITQLLLHHGLQLQQIKPMWYDSFYVSMLSEKYMSGKNNLLKAAWNGYVSNYRALFNKERCSSLIYVVTL